MTRYFVSTPEELTLLSQAVNILSGLSEPVRGEVVGGPDTLPREFRGAGTPGWTDTVFRGSWVSADQSIAAVEVLPDMLAFSGQSVQIGDVLVTLPTEAEGVDQLPPELLPENGAFWWSGADPQAADTPPPDPEPLP